MIRYIVETEHIRGEKRLFWVEDLQKPYGRGFKQVTDHTTDKRVAERACDKLNAALMSPAQSGTGAQ